METSMNSIEPIDPLGFQVAWEITLKCNMDCSYCGDGHNNKTLHPNKEECLKTVDFIFDYLDIQMSDKLEHLRFAGINIQGGESIFHPDILEIINYAYSKKEDKPYNVTINLITNAVCGQTLWNSIVQKIDYFTISYHAEMNSKQEILFKDNVKTLLFYKKNFVVNIMMHPKNELWEKCLKIIKWCEDLKISYHMRAIDHHWLDIRFNYSSEQATFLTKQKKQISLLNVVNNLLFKTTDVSSQGRACCGGNDLCLNKSTNVKFVNGNNFNGWHCSVDKYFLYIKQYTGEVFTNKDCKMNWDNKVGAIGNLKDTGQILNRLKTGTPVIICKKNKCWCGLCAPKAKTAEDFELINHKNASKAIPQLKDL